MYETNSYIQSKKKKKLKLRNMMDLFIRIKWPLISIYEISSSVLENVHSKNFRSYFNFLFVHILKSFEREKRFVCLRILKSGSTVRLIDKFLIAHFFKINCWQFMRMFHRLSGSSSTQFVSTHLTEFFWEFSTHKRKNASSINILKKFDALTRQEQVDLLLLLRHSRWAFFAINGGNKSKWIVPCLSML